MFPCENLKLAKDYQNSTDSEEFSECTSESEQEELLANKTRRSLQKTACDIYKKSFHCKNDCLQKILTEKTISTVEKEWKRINKSHIDTSH